MTIDVLCLFSFFCHSLYLVDPPNHRLYMEKIAGSTMKDLLRSVCNGEYPESAHTWAKEIGIVIGKMHDADIVHGDLTTSNIMIREVDNKAILIDFGLSTVSTVLEDKAVDLYVLERAFISTHPGSEELVSYPSIPFVSSLSTYVCIISILLLLVDLRSSRIITCSICLLTINPTTIFDSFVCL